MKNYYWSMESWGYDYPPENADDIISAANEQIDMYAEEHDDDEIRNFSAMLWERYCSGSKAWSIIADGLYDQAVALMDDELREQVHREIAPCSDIEFLEAYMVLHEQKYGEEFTV